MLLETARCIPVKGTRPSGISTGAAAPGAAAFRLGFISPVAILISSAVTRPNSPVPSMVARSILAFLARARAWGVAATTPGAGVHLGLEGAAAFLAGAPPEAAFWTSPAVMRPPGPVPATVLISTPISVAIFLASGEATTRPPAEAAGLAAAAALGAALAGAAAAGAAAAEAAGAGAPLKLAAYALSAGISPSLAAIKATGDPTLAASPSSVMMAAMNPSSKASTSMSALSDSTTMMASPASTESPSPLSQETTLPSFMVEERAGISSWLNSTSGASPPAAGASSAAGAASSAAGAAAAPLASPPSATAAMSDSSVATNATTAPTSALSPSSVKIFARNPSSNASTSISALSDSTTMIASPASISSPSLLSHDTTRPSFMVDDNAGMVILMASALSEVSYRMASAMALFDGKMVCGLAEGAEGTNADTTLVCCAVCHEEMRQMSAVLEIPAINFNFIRQCRPVVCLKGYRHRVGNATSP
mmetsp:Transcript_31448/g.66596  ORF Transcript_31448/g.66596 Transcript_31448/m.66596 type:complete len:479 (-) Transcript_31448:764-2200(-)